MRNYFLVAVALASPFAKASEEIVKVKLADREIMTAKLNLPDSVTPVKQIVIFVHRTGPNTYLNRRKVGSIEFNYFDIFVEEFNKRGVGFLAYNRRGVTLSDKPPTFESIDQGKFAKAVPSVEVDDIGSLVSSLKRQTRFKNTKITLLGWSEGTIIAALAAEDKRIPIHALLLAGYANDNMYDLIKWQFSGANSMLNLGPIFDANRDLRISMEEYNTSEAQAAQVRTTTMKDTKFEQLDLNNDGFITKDDFGQMMNGRYDQLMTAITKGDSNWIWDNYFHISMPWINAHFALEPNKTRLLRLDLPIDIFQGTNDANTPVEGALDIQKRFSIQKKSNLKVHIFEGHGHDLNFFDYINQKQVSAGHRAIFDAAERLNN